MHQVLSDQTDASVFNALLEQQIAVLAANGIEPDFYPGGVPDPEHMRMEIMLLKMQVIGLETCMTQMQRDLAILKQFILNTDEENANGN